MALILASLSAATYGIADFLGGMASKRAPVLKVILVSHLVGLALVTTWAGLFEAATPTATTWLWGAGAGLSGLAGLALLYQGLATQRMSIVAPLAALSNAITPAAFGLIRGDRPSTSAWIGIVLALGAIWAISTGAGGVHGATAQAVGYGLGAGMGFGAFFILLSRAPEGVWPLVASRSMSLLTLVVLVTITTRSLRPPAGTGLSMARIGIFDTAANILFLFAVRRGLFTIVAVISSLYPATTILMARITLDDRMDRVQGAGLVLAAAGVGLIAAG